KETYTNKGYYFDRQYPVHTHHLESLLASFYGKKTMYLTQPYQLRTKGSSEGADKIASENGQILSLIMSYPFNKVNPDVYLSVNIDGNQLIRSVHVQESWISSTGIVDVAGHVVIQGGDRSIAIRDWLNVIETDKTEILHPINQQ